jgi:F0F1-type ATP synthase assembly protein I
MTDKGKRPNKSPIISEDGELAIGAAHLYCTRCGAANPSNSNFCRKCGHSLEDQEAEMMGIPDLPHAVRGVKAKADQQQVVTPEEVHKSVVAATLIQIFTMLAVAGMGITAFVMGGGDSWPAAIPIFIAWFLVEGVRGKKRLRAEVGYAISTILTVLLVCGLAITALTMNQAAAVIPIMIGWFLIEGIRSEG